MNQQVKTGLGAAILFIIAVTAGTFVQIRYNQDPIADYNVDQQVQRPKPVDKIIQPKACTQEAKVCSDGSAVGRTGENCEFALCPDELVEKSRMANPASVFCEQNGGKLEIRTEISGGQVGYCKFSNGTECEEWKYFRGECGNANAVDISDWKTYRNEKYGFEFKYPADWNIDNLRLSPQKIENYDIGSDNAPIHFNIISPDENVFLADDYSEIIDGRWAFDLGFAKGKSVSDVKSNGLELRRYDWYDGEGKYEGDTSGNNIIVVSPEFNVNGNALFVSFEWEQFPGGEKLLKNNPDDFIKIISTFKFTK